MNSGGLNCSTRFVHLRAQDCKVWIQGDAARDLGVTVGATHLTLDLDHPSVTPSQRGEGKVRKGSSDKLRLAIFDPERPQQPKVWKDDDAAPLERQLTDMVIGVMMMAEAAYRHRCMATYQYALKHRDEMRARLDKEKAAAEAAERQRQADEARARRERLSAQLQDWRLAKDLRGFIDAVAEQGVDPTPDLAAWISWAQAVADEIDPLGSGRLTQSFPSAEPN